MNVVRQPHRPEHHSVLCGTDRRDGALDLLGAEAALGEQRVAVRPERVALDRVPALDVAREELDVGAATFEHAAQQQLEHRDVTSDVRLEVDVRHVRAEKHAGRF